MHIFSVYKPVRSAASTKRKLWAPVLTIFALLIQLTVQVYTPWYLDIMFLSFLLQMPTVICHIMWTSHRDDEEMYRGKSKSAGATPRAAEGKKQITETASTLFPFAFRVSFHTRTLQNKTKRYRLHSLREDQKPYFLF